MSANTTLNALPAPVSPLQADVLKQDFPIFQTITNGKPLVYLDNGATTQKPRAMIDAISHFYGHTYGTVRRGVYALSAKATQQFQQVRVDVASFLNAPSPDNIVFVRGCTEAINLVTQTYGRQHVGAGDNVVISALEHHANLVPWQQLCLQVGAQLRVIPVLDDGTLDLQAYETLLDERTKVVAIGHVSNAIGTIHPVKGMIATAHAHGAVVLLDGAQSAPHMLVDVQDLDADFYCFSGHKLYGPTGVGVLYGKTNWLQAMPPYHFGGDMIEWVTFDKTTFQAPPMRFEAGTPAIAEVIGLGASIRYVQPLGMDAIAQHEDTLLTYATQQLQALPELTIIGTTKAKAGILSFVLQDIHPHDIGSLLDADNIAVRAGHHCAQPVMERFGVPATVRASFGIYNTPADVDALVAGLKKIITLFA
jgi:cysteine desulfurase / selenocysteine lyase